MGCYFYDDPAAHVILSTQQPHLSSHKTGAVEDDAMFSITIITSGKRVVLVFAFQFLLFVL